MRNTIERLFRLYGAETVLTLPAGEKTVRAVVRPVPGKSLEHGRIRFDELGVLPGGLYLFLGPADCGLREAETVEFRGEIYLPRRAETLTLGERPCYVWGLLTKGGTADGGASGEGPDAAPAGGDPL